MHPESTQAHAHPHVVAVPKWVLFVHIAQMLLALLVLGLVSYSLHVYNASNFGNLYDFNLPIVNSWGFNIFTVLYTWIIITYIELSSRVLPAFYNKWAASVLEIVAAIFWLCAFSSLAGYITTTILFTCGSQDIYGYLYDCTLAPRNSSISAAGIGGLLFILFVITAVILGLRTFRHYKSTRTPAQQNQVPFAGEQTQAPNAGQPNEKQNVTGMNQSMTEGAGINASGDAHNYAVNPGYNSQTPNVQNQGVYNQPPNMQYQGTHNEPVDMPNHAAYQQSNTQSNPPYYASTGA